MAWTPRPEPPTGGPPPSRRSSSRRCGGGVHVPGEGDEITLEERAAAGLAKAANRARQVASAARAAKSSSVRDWDASSRASWDSLVRSTSATDQQNAAAPKTPPGCGKTDKSPTPHLHGSDMREACQDR
eukprot:8324972-Alexandrium_andersonii.AAC.1